MTLETRLRNTGFPPSGGGSGSSNSSGLAGVSPYYLLNSGNSTLTNSLTLKAGSSVTLASDATAVYITAITNAAGAANSAGLAGTGGYYILGSANSTLPFSSVVQPGSSVSFNYTGSNLFISAITNSAVANSGGLAGTGGLFVVTSASPLFPNSRILKAGSSVTVITDGTSIYITALTGGGGSSTPGGSDTQIQVNSQNAFAGFPNLRWISSSNSLDLNTAGRIRHGGVAEVDGVAPTGVTGLVWLDTGTSASNTIPFLSVVTKTANYTVTNADDLVLGNATTGSFTVTLPTAVGISGRVFYVKSISSSNNVTVGTVSSQKIDVATTYVLPSNYGSVTLVSDNAQWWIV